MPGLKKQRSSGVKIGKVNIEKIKNGISINEEELLEGTLDEIENNPKSKKDPEAVAARRIVRARISEERRKSKTNKRKYTKYLNEYFLSIVCNATGYKSWTRLEKDRLKRIRIRITEVYNIPLNYYQVFVYRTLYRYLEWDKHDIMYSNFVGFMNSDTNVLNAAKYLSNRNMIWRYRHSQYPNDFRQNWGKPVPIRYQKIGINDCIVKHDLHSDYITKRINRFR